jgi:DNA-binding Lrp family transcriptional regulator
VLSVTEEGTGPRSTKAKTPHPLDDIDRRLLRLLMANSRMSNSRLAQGANVAESTAHTRVAALVDSGVILGFHADLELVAVGLPIHSLVLVRLHDHARPQLRQEAHRLSKCAGVLQVLFLAGQYDLAVRVAVATTGDLRDFVVNELSRHLEIAGTETALVLEAVRGDGPQLPS